MVQLSIDWYRWVFDQSDKLPIVKAILEYKSNQNELHHIFQLKISNIFTWQNVCSHDGACNGSCKTPRQIEQINSSSIQLGNLWISKPIDVDVILCQICLPILIVVLSYGGEKWPVIKKFQSIDIYMWDEEKKKKVECEMEIKFLLREDKLNLRHQECVACLFSILKPPT